MIKISMKRFFILVFLEFHGQQYVILYNIIHGYIIHTRYNICNMYIVLLFMDVISITLFEYPKKFFGKIK